MLNHTLNRREEEFQNLTNFTKKIHQEIIDVSSALGWSIDSMKTNNENSLVCPYDSSHRISKETLDQHLESCQWKSEGYNEYSVPLPESSSSLISPSSIKLDVLLQNNILQEAQKKDSSMKIDNYECPTWHKLYILSKHEFLTLIIGLGERLIPQTSDRIFTDFTRDERKALYEYVVSHTVKTDIGHDITDTHKPKDQGKDDKKLSFLELLVQERNLKRRRAKHKGVHTNKKSHTEILREVINQQMEAYMDYTTEMQAISYGTKADSVVEARRSNKHFDNGTLRLSLQFNEASSKRRNVSLDDSLSNRGTSNFRYDQKYEHFEKSSGSYDKNFDKRDKCSRITTETWKTHRSHKHRRSRSRERSHNRRGEHSSTRQDHKRHSERCYETEKSFNSKKYFKRKKDHRENREKLEL